MANFLATVSKIGAMLSTTLTMTTSSESPLKNSNFTLQGYWSVRYRYTSPFTGPSIFWLTVDGSEDYHVRGHGINLLRFEMTPSRAKVKAYEHLPNYFNKI